MIRAKLISPTNLLLEHPLYLAQDDAGEFVVMGKREYESRRKETMLFGILMGALLFVGLGFVFVFAKALL